MSVKTYYYHVTTRKTSTVYYIRVIADLSIEILKKNFSERVTERGWKEVE